MKNIITKLSTSSFRYDPWKLVNRHQFTSVNDLSKPVQIISDIDKTYLETSFESLRKIATIVLENACDKQNVAGAKEYLRSILYHLNRSLFPHYPSHQSLASLHFVSSSPPQLRTVLEHKISLDYISSSSDCFKDQIYNLKKAKLSLIKHQITYKLCALLSLISQFKQTKRIIMIGDNKESDPIVYLIVKYLISGRWTKEHCIECLKYLEVPIEHSLAIFKKIDLDLIYDLQNPPLNIMIRSLPNVTFKPWCEYISSEITWFDSYLDLALISYYSGLISPQGIDHFLQTYQDRYLSSILNLQHKINYFFDLQVKLKEYSSLDKAKINHSPYLQKILSVSFSTLSTFDHRYNHSDNSQFFASDDNNNYPSLDQDQNSFKKPLYGDKSIANALFNLRSGDHQAQTPKPYCQKDYLVQQKLLDYFTKWIDLNKNSN